MKTKTLLPIMMMIVAPYALVGCTNGYSCSCADSYPDLYAPYTPEKYTLSWTDFNPIFNVQEYFCYHDSTKRMHVGDTIMLYGGIDDINVHPEGDHMFELQDPQALECLGTCFRSVVIHTPKRPVEEWMTEKYRVVYVKGIITSNYWLRIEAIQYDSVRF